MKRLCALLACALAVAPAAAQEATDQVIVDVPAVPMQGRVGVNLAAGGNNQQANVGVLAIGDTAVATGLIHQDMGGRSRDLAGSRQAFINGDSFSGSSGMTAVNVASGSDNQQANLALIAIGLEGAVATDAMLSQTRASQEPGGGQETVDVRDYSTGIAPGAFAGSDGLVQVSLIGGERNTSANVFTLTMAASVSP